MHLSSLSVWRPDEILTNEELARMVDTTDEWIVDHVGIRERRRSPREMPIHEMGARAARLALAGVDPASIDLVICGLSVTDFEIPATANLIAAEVGIDEGAAFDIRAACSSFVFCLHTVRALLASGSHRRALLVIPEAYTHVTDYTDRNNCILWGDAAVACIASVDRPPGLSYEVRDTRIGSRSADHGAIYIRKGGSFQQRGPAVQRFAIRRMTAIIEEQLAASSLAASNVAWFVGHQANLSILKRVRERLGIAPAQMLSNLERYGNTGAAGAPSVLADRQGNFRDGEQIVVATVGAGLSWGTSLLRVCKEEPR